MGKVINQGCGIRVFRLGEKVLFLRTFVIVKPLELHAFIEMNLKSAGEIGVEVTYVYKHQRNQKETKD